MVRTALRPRWLALLAVVLLAATAMSLLGRWQLDRARVHGEQEAASEHAQTRPVGQVIRPRTTFPKDGVGVPVSATGRWDGERRLLVGGRELGGRSGYWVLVPLRQDDGSAVPVVRGWVPSATDPAAAPSAHTGPGTVQGVLQPTEPAAQHEPGQAPDLPEGQIERADVTELIEHWPYPLITGFVVATTPTAGLVTVPPPVASAGLDLRNLAYALQWWLFAAFGLFFWWRIVRDDHLNRLPRTREHPVREDGPRPEPVRGVAP
jgi:surfeit locus 1 family protein